MVLERNGSRNVICSSEARPNRPIMEFPKGIYQNCTEVRKRPVCLLAPAEILYKYHKSHHQFEKAKTVAYKRNGFSNGRHLSTVEDSTTGKFETKKNFRSYSVHEKEINADFNDDLQAAIVSRP